MSALVPVTVSEVIVIPEGGQPVVVLREIAGTRELTMWVSPEQAYSISCALADIEPVRPLAHDLLIAVLAPTGASLSRAVIHGAVEDEDDITFLASIFLNAGGHAIELDARPSDAVAIALRAGVPILVADDLLDVGEEEIDAQLGVFKDFIEKLPDSGASA